LLDKIATETGPIISAEIIARNIAANFQEASGDGVTQVTYA
jgi:hypothetical protein